MSFVSFHEQCLDSTGPFSGRDILNVCYLGKAGIRKDIGAEKGRIKGCKSGREDNRAFHTLCTPVRASLTSSRNDSGMPDTAKKPAARKPAAKAPAPTATASAVTKAMLAKVGRAYKKADMPNVSEQKKPSSPRSCSPLASRS